MVYGLGFEFDDDISLINKKYENNPKHIDTIEDILQKDTINGELLRGLKERAEYEGLSFDYEAGNGGRQWFKLGEETTHCSVHRSPDNNALMIMSEKELLKYPWWKDIVYNVLKPSMILLDEKRIPNTPL